MKTNQYTQFDEDVDVLEEIETSKKIIVYNDDFNSFNHVINCFVKYCKHSPEQAEQCVLLVHTKGKCSVKVGDYDKLKPIKEALSENGIDAKIEE